MLILQWQPTPVLLPGKSHEWRSLVGCSPWSCWGLDTTEWLHFHFSLSCIGEGSGNPLQCSCLDNSRDRRAWWAAVYGVVQSRTRLKWLSSMLAHRLGHQYLILCKEKSFTNVTFSNNSYLTLHFSFPETLAFGCISSMKFIIYCLGLQCLGHVLMSPGRLQFSLGQETYFSK